MVQTVKDTVLEIKEVVFGEHLIDVEGYAIELSNRSNLSFDDIKDMFNNMTLILINEKNPSYNKGNRKLWSKGEDQLVHHYVDLANDEVYISNGKQKSKSKNSIFEELEEILVNRTSQSISFRYYETKRALKDDANDVFQEVSVTKETPRHNKQPMNSVKSIENAKGDDLLNMVIGLVDNVESVGIDINGLLKGMLNLSQRAIENSNVEKVGELEGKVDFLESELDKEKQKNEKLQNEVAKLINEFGKLRNEVMYFDGLNGKQKLQQLQNFNRNIKYMVDKFGGVISVGVEKAI